MKANVINYRKGFATNSSSAHSIIIFKDNIEKKFKYDYQGDGDYGWDSFTLTTPDSKKLYMSMQLLCKYDTTNIFNIKEIDIDEYKDNFYKNKVIIEICNKLNLDITVLYEYIITNFCKYDDTKITIPNQYGLIDHQSVLSLNEIENIIPLLHYDNVIIFGGNDNEGNDINRYNELYNLNSNYIEIDSSNKIKKDKNAIVIYNKYNGEKIRLSDTEYNKSTYPELVDLKITDYCPYGCEFCYQSSTKKGLHASLDSIKKIVNELADKQVFEIALGGGEPTMHPDFIEILQYISDNQITVNFTTYSTAWLNNKNIVDAVNRYVSAIGVSIHNLKDINKFNKIKQKIDHGQKIVAQHVLNSTTLNETCNIINDIISNNGDILLLGFKDFGFGLNYQKNNFSVKNFTFNLKLILDNLQNKYFTISVDTKVVQEYKKVLMDVLNVNPILMTAEEGKFSCYIDAVTNKISESSYSNNMYDLELSKFDEIYSKF